MCLICHNTTNSLHHIPLSISTVSSHIWMGSYASFERKSLMHAIQGIFKRPAYLQKLNSQAPECALESRQEDGPLRDVQELA